MKIYSILFISILISCNQNEKMKREENYNLRIKPLSPYSYEFRDNQNNLNNIVYFYLDEELANDFSLNEKIEKTIMSQYNKVDSKYVFNSIYIYRKTNILNNKYSAKSNSFDGFNDDLLVYARFVNKKLDMCYVIDKGIVTYNVIENKKVNFEFEQ